MPIGSTAAATFAALGFDPCDHIAHLLGTMILVRQEVVTRQARKPQRNDAAEQGPTGNGIETIVHSKPHMEFAPALQALNSPPL